MKIKVMIVLILANLMTCYSRASVLSNEELSKIRQDAENIAISGLGDVQGIFNDAGKQKDIQSLMSENPATIDQVSHRGTDLNNTPSLGSNLREKEEEKCTKNSCNVSYAFSKNATDARNSKMEETTGIIRDPKTGEIVDNQGWLDRAKYEVKNAHRSVDFLSGAYTDCTPQEKATISKNTKVCDEYYDAKRNICSAIQKVEIDPKYTYMCVKKRKEKEKRCREVLDLTCIEYGEAEKEENKLDFMQELNLQLAEQGGFCAILCDYSHRKWKVLPVFLGNQGVCVKNIALKLIEFFKRFENYHCYCPYLQFISSGANVYVNSILERAPSMRGWQNLIQTGCMKKQCLKWQENWEKQCEYY